MQIRLKRPKPHLHTPPPPKVHRDRKKYYRPAQKRRDRSEKD